MKTATENRTLSESQEAELKRLKQYRPFMLCFGAIKGEQFELWAAGTKHRAKRYVRDGWTVFHC